MSTKRQTTMAKMQREQAVRERRARKQQKRADRKADKLRVSAESGVGVPAGGEPTPDAVENPIEPAEPAEDTEEQAQNERDDGAEGVGWPLRAPGTS